MVACETILQNPCRREAAMFTFDRYDRQMKNFGDMTTTLDIDPVDFARDCLGYRLATAIRRCSACQAGDTCRAWLAHTTHADNAPAFCPNRDVFAMVRRTPAKPQGEAGAT
jgi:hypothetical protein